MSERIDAVPRWKPYPALKVTAALHAAGAAALVAQPTLWPAVAAGLVANHGVLFAACMMPRSSVLGPNLVRLPAAAAARSEVALTFDDGPDPEITPRVLDLLEKRAARASFFCIGERAAAQPRLMREIVARGHAVESHSLRHTLGFGWYGPRRLRREVEGAQRAIADGCGVAPVFFRAPFGVRNPMLDQVLARRRADLRDLDAARLRHPRRRLGACVAPTHLRPARRRRADAARRLRGRDPGAVLSRLLAELDARGLRSVTLREALQ